MKQKPNISIGQKFGESIVTSLPFQEGKHERILVKCSCGVERSVRTCFLKKINKCTECAQKGVNLDKKNPIGTRFHNLEIIQYLRPSDVQKYIIVRCDCGKEFGLTHWGRSKKCINCNRGLKGSDSFLYTGTKYISSTRMSRIKTTAKARGLECNVSIEYLNDLLIKQNFKCSLSGLPIYLSTTCNAILNKSTGSLDRIDNSKGYIEGNVQWVHKDINTMKMNLKQENFIEYCQLISRHATEI